MVEANSPEPRDREESGSRADESGDFDRPPAGLERNADPEDIPRPKARVKTATASSSTIRAREREAEEAIADPKLPPARPPTLLHSDGMLFLIAGVLATAIAGAVFLGSEDWRGLGASPVLLLLTAVVAWLAFGLRNNEQAAKQSGVWAAAIAGASLGALIAQVGALPIAVVLAGVLVVLMWSGVLLRPRWNLLLGLAAFTGLLLMSNSSDSPAAALELPVAVMFLAVPLGLGATLQLQRRTAERTRKSSISKLEQLREELKSRLQAKVGELELSREQLFEAQKLKTVGTMASGLAHELNTILSPIHAHAESINSGEADVDQSRRYGQRILDSAATAAQITGALLTYTRQGTFQPVRSNLRQLLQGQILPVLSKSLPGNVRLKVDYARNVSVDVDRVLFQQAIANLVFNAVDAMPEGGEITITLGTSSRPPNDDDDEWDDDAQSDEDIQRSAVLSVADTGTGIDDEHIDKIFDPFFTTKAVGSGSGLGLAWVMGTITRHHGRVLVESKLGLGTTFTLMLPLASSEEKESVHKPWPVLRGESKGPVVVVLTEDQDALDEFEELLELTECAPICTNDAKGATPLLTEMGDKVDLLILDLELEAVDGTRLFKTVRELFPEMPVILLSDSPTNPTVQRMIGAGPTRSVRKPMDNRLFSALLTDLLHPNEEGYVRDFTPVPITPGADISGPHPRAG